ncbi:MAG: MFS transporter [Betaproteobacteria bacterium]|nr:MFS transporter [Betaproteobacteria bacterium]
MAAAPQSAVRLTLLMCAAESLSMTGFACFTTLLPVLMKAWGLNNSEAGLISGVFYTGYMLAVPVLTSLTDRVDSRRVYLFACALSAVGAGGFAWFANGLWSALVFQFLIGAGLAGTYMPGLSAAFTAGVIAATAPERRGATMAVYSFSGFTTAFLAPLVFGVVLDLAGGNQSQVAWGFAFASIGIFGVLAPAARWIYWGQTTKPSQSA